MRNSVRTAMAALAASIAAVPALAIQDPAAVHQNLLTLDTHLDTPIHFARPGWRMGDRHGLETDIAQVDQPRMVEGGLDGGFFVIYTSQGELTEQGFAEAGASAAQRQLEILLMLATNAGTLEAAWTADDAERIVARGRGFVFQSIENSYPLGEDISALQGFYDRGVRMAGPVHFRNNQFADSSTDPEPRWNGLSPLGRELIVEMNRLGIVPDGSHASDDVVDQMIELSATPIILSHSGPQAIFDHPRNLTDERIRRLAESGGVIAVNSVYLSGGGDEDTVRDELTERLESLAAMSAEEQAAAITALRAYDAEHPRTEADFETFMASVLHLIEVAGVDHVAFGADWDGGGGVVGMRDITALPQITERLIAAGYGEDDLAKMWSGNVLRLLREAEAYSASLAD
ncbi:dipeptidase [Parasphingopyxis marina]|nr:dipeptidase [Parasphingopyxis marina]